MAKIRKIYIDVWEKWAKRSIFGQKIENEKFCPNYFSPFFKIPKTSSYGKNPKRNKSKFYGCPTSCKKPEKNDSAILAAEPEGTDARE